MATELELIERIRARITDHSSVPTGIGDDAALLRPEPGQLLAASTDSLIPGQHFLEDWPPDVIGALSLAVNLSDLAAMAARPRWALLALTLPNADADWLDSFFDGFLELAAVHEVVLAGGNLARGPLNIGVQVLGEVSLEQAALRTGVQAGDLIAVTGTLGDAAAAWHKDSANAALIQRWQRPTARVQAGRVLGAYVHAMMDISDGLLADLGKLLQASQMGAEIDLLRLPASAALREQIPNALDRARQQAVGGSDYELLFTLSPDDLEEVKGKLQTLGESITVIGRVTDFDGLKVLDESGQNVELNQDGWDHFKG